MKKLLLTLTVALATMVAASTASAFSWTEESAGQTLDTADVVTGVGSLDAIYGGVLGGTDLYRVYLTGDPFLATVTTIEKQADLVYLTYREKTSLLCCGGEGGSLFKHLYNL